MNEIRTIHWNAVFRDFNNSTNRYRIAKGSAGSGKSVNTAQNFIKRLAMPEFKGCNLLCIRKVECTNRNSTFAELQKAIYSTYGEHADSVWQINRGMLTIKCIPTGNEIIFKGAKDDGQREKIKSITFSNGKLTWIWCEEATELTPEDFDILDDRLRGILPDGHFYQITATFNPVNAQHWIKKRFFDHQDPAYFTHHSTYLNNRFIDDEFHKRMERRREQDPDGYRVYGLGEWGELGGQILTNYVVEEFHTEWQYFDGMAMGTDFGFNHAHATLLLGWKDGDIFICDEVYEHQKTTEELIRVLQAFDRNLPMYCDSAEPDRIKTLRQAGFQAQKVKKESGSVKAQIDWLKARKIHIHPRCVNTYKEIEQWRWDKDRNTGQYIDRPIEVLDDAMAALRYGVEGWRRGMARAVNRPKGW